MESRRNFLQVLSAGALAAQQTGAGLPTRVLGRTGVRVSVLGLGGWHIGSIKDDNEAIRLMHTAIDEGLTFFDNAWDYHDGRSEELMGKALAMDGRRNRAFVMTKNCERDYAGSMRNLEDSLRRLRTDRIDLWQFHEMVYDNDPDWVFEKGGIKAAIEARQQGKVRFIGFTGHKDPRIHLKMLAKPHAWDAVQMPVNIMDPHYRSFIREVLPACAKNNVGVIGMKGLGGGEGRFLTHAGLTVNECVRFCLSQPVAVQIMGITNMQQLKQNIGLARAFKPLSQPEADQLLSRVKDMAGDGRHELFKSTKAFDGPHHRKQHGFDTQSAD
jgi:aryl-alcohol dehydrogenase-like predicted oxidoreductase